MVIIWLWKLMLARAYLLWGRVRSYVLVLFFLYCSTILIQSLILCGISRFLLEHLLLKHLLLCKRLCSRFAIKCIAMASKQHEYTINCAIYDESCAQTSYKQKVWLIPNILHLTTVIFYVIWAAMRSWWNFIYFNTGGHWCKIMQDKL